MRNSAAARHRLIDAVLSREASGDAYAVGTATQTALASFNAELATLLGQRSVRALYDRSLHLASVRYPWLDPTAGAPTDEPLADLQGRLAERSADEARAAGVALLVEFTGLLAALIGESLTDRLLRKAWEGRHPQNYPTSENRK